MGNNHVSVTDEWLNPLSDWGHYSYAYDVSKRPKWHVLRFFFFSSVKVQKVSDKASLCEAFAAYLKFEKSDIHTMTCVKIREEPNISDLVQPFYRLSSEAT